MALSCVSSGHAPEPPVLLAPSLGDSPCVRRVPSLDVHKPLSVNAVEQGFLPSGSSQTGRIHGRQPCLPPQSLLRSWTNSLPSLPGPAKRWQESLVRGLLLPQCRELLPPRLLEVREGPSGSSRPAYCPLLYGDHPLELAQPGLRCASHGLPGVGVQGRASSWPVAAVASGGHVPRPSLPRLVALPPFSLFFSLFLMLCLKDDIIQFS